MTMNDAPTTPGAPDQLRLMNRLYLEAVLDPAADRAIADKLKGRSRGCNRLNTVIRDNRVAEIPVEGHDKTYDEA